MNPSVLDVDRLTAAELRALSFGEQVEVLNSLFSELQRLADVKCLAIDVLADAKMQAIKAPDSADCKANVIDAKRDFDKVGVAIQARKQQVSVLQTLVRGVPT